MKNYEEQIREYVEQMKENIKEYDFNDYIKEDQDQEDLYEKLYHDMWVDDSITGNGSANGYTCGDQEEAKEMVIDAVDIAVEAVHDFCCEEEAFKRLLKRDYIYIDTTIRCYLLGQALEEALREKGLYE